MSRGLPFWDRVDTDGDCWEWRGATGAGGYGTYVLNGVKWYVHRYAYTDRVGPIPEGLTIDHLCKNKMCVRPDHLEAVTRSENASRTVGTTRSPGRYPTRRY